MTTATPIRISAGYQETVSENYNSKRYSVQLEMDAMINGSVREVEDATAKLFELCRNIVSREKGTTLPFIVSRPNPNALPSNSPMPTQSQMTGLPFNQEQESSHSAPSIPTVVNNSPTASQNNYQPMRPATEKQIHYLLQTAKRHGLSSDRIKGLPREIFGKTDYNALESNEASRIIDNLKDGSIHP